MTDRAHPGVAADLLDFAVKIAVEAGRTTLAHFRSGSLQIDTKADGTAVTVADRGAETVIRARLAERFPDDGVLGEEQGEHAGQSGRRWIIDPIDGTTPFTKGVPLYSNLLALEDEAGEILVGVINLPALGITVAAGRGAGCFINGKAAHASAHRPTLQGAYVMTSGVETWNADQLARLQASGARLRTWGDAYGYAQVATGYVEAMVDPIAAVWDLAPMPVILAEAGGNFTDRSGVVTHCGGHGVASCGGTLHDQLLAVLAG